MATGKGYVFSSLMMISLGLRSLITSVLLLWICPSTFAQLSPIRTDMPVPPLQWLNLTGLTSGPTPQPLKDSSIGYDEATRSLIIFGGESQAGFPQQTTYLLNMDSLTWSTPSSRVPQFSSSPPARSRALGTGDFAANSRRDFLVYGGKGSGDQALSDVWAYDFLNQFWFNIRTIGTPPSPRWGAVGGIDPADIANSANNVSTVFNIIGGSNSNTIFSTSDFWQLNVTGTLASDLTSIQGVWQELPVPSRLAGKVEAGGALISQSQATNTRIVISGGCGTNANPLSANISCVDVTTDVLTISPPSSFSPPQCPAPRLGPVLVPNLSTASSSFLPQAFMLLGTFDTSKWDDGGSLVKGEVAILDVSAGTWARVLPAGDPSSGTVTFPPPREGAAALSFPSALVGGNRAGASDTIIFGGRNAQGGYMNDLWILRAYNGSITRSGDHWSGFGDGKLETGISASGNGVSLTYLSQCANSIGSTSTSSTTTPSSSAGSPAQTSTGTVPITDVPPFDVSIVHKLLSALSIVFALVATVLVRLSLPSMNSTLSTQRLTLYWYLGIPVAFAAYGLGVAGFASSLISTTRSSPSLQRRSGTSPDTLAKTVHGRAGLALFVGSYGLVPLLYIGIWFTHRPLKHLPGTPGSDGHRKNSEETGPLAGEKELLDDARPVSPARSAPEMHSTESSVRVRRQRAQSGPGLLPGWRGRENNESTDPGPSKGFEVVNRPRRASGGMVLYPLQDHPPRPRDLMRSLNDMSWLDRRRSVSAVGELDYALSQLDHTSPQSMSPPITSRPPTVTMSNRPFVRTPTPPVLSSSPKLSGRDIFMHLIFHTFLLANCILVLVALFSRAPIATFVVFLVWTLAFYFSLFFFAWNGRPRASVLTIALSRLRMPSTPVLPSSPTDEPPTDERESNVYPSPGSSPYIYHQPLWRRAVSPEEDLATRTSHGRPTSDLDEQDDDDDEDESERQRRMEEELERRDVNIVTVPRRKLWITNPS